MIVVVLIIPKREFYLLLVLTISYIVSTSTDLFVIKSHT